MVHRREQEYDVHRMKLIPVGIHSIEPLLKSPYVEVRIPSDLIILSNLVFYQVSMMNLNPNNKHFNYSRQKYDAN